MTTIIVIAVIAAIILYVISVYNQLVRLKSYVQESWTQIDVQLIRRCDLIPNLVEIAKGYAAHEREAFESIAAMRSQITNMCQSNAPKDQIMQQSDMLSGSLRSVFALSESYPELKADKNFTVLQEELISTENKIAYARQLYNKTVVSSYNLKIQTFPTIIVAKMLGFKEEKALIEASQEQKHAVKIQF